MPRKYSRQVQIICANCGKPKMRPPSLVSPERNFCSRPCYYEFNRTQRGPRVERVNCVCRYCGEPFELRPGEVSAGRGHFCSPNCYHLWCRGENHGRYKEVHPDRRDGRGYIHQFARNHPRASGDGYVRQHILVAEEMLGGPLPEGTIVHHINGDKADNRPENLAIMTASEHARLHGGARDRGYTDEQLIAALQELARRVGATPAGKDLSKYPDLPSFAPYWERYGGWDAALRAAGFDPATKRNNQRLSDDELLEAIRHVAAETGRTPMLSDFQSGSGLPSRSLFFVRFGSWKNALEAAGFVPNTGRRRPRSRD